MRKDSGLGCEIWKIQIPLALVHDDGGGDDGGRAHVRDGDDVHGGVGDDGGDRAHVRGDGDEGSSDDDRAHVRGDGGSIRVHVDGDYPRN